MILGFLFWAFVAYLLYKLVFGFILPVYRTTQRVKRSFREMNERMREQASGQAAPPPQTKVSSTAAKTEGGDYIEFEEVK